MCLSWIQACTAIHLLWSALYISVGAVQIVAGIFFLVTVPVLKIGSNIWTGSWNVFFGVGGAVFSCVGDWTSAKQRGLLSLTITILIVNLINLIILEIAEWRYLTPESAKQIMSKRGMETLVAYARYTTSLSTLAGIIGSFLDSQITFCCMQRKDKTKQHTEPENNSDVDYIIPRVKSEGIIRQDSAGIKVANADYGRSWVFEADATGAGNAYASTESLSDNARRPAAVCGSRTVTLKRKAKPVTPVVIVEVDGTGSRPAQLMTSFSRTPSPVGLSESSSQDSMTAGGGGGCGIGGGGVAAAPIYECLEKLTEPSVYRSRLNTALSVGTPDSPVDRPAPRSLSPKPPPAAEPVQYASLMEELQKTIGNRLSKHVESSDERFSAELDDVLKDIQELESPTGEHSAERTDESSDSDAASMKTTRTVILNGKQHLDDLGYVSMRQDCAHLLSVYEQVDCRRNDGGGANAAPYPEETNNNTIGLDVVAAANRPSCKGWKALSTMLKRKQRAVLTLTPEIEASIVKSECLAYLSEKELVERYDRNKMVHRQIEERVWKKINGASETDSPC